MRRDLFAPNARRMPRREMDRDITRDLTRRHTAHAAEISTPRPRVTRCPLSHTPSACHTLSTWQAHAELDEKVDGVQKELVLRSDRQARSRPHLGCISAASRPYLGRADHG